MRFLKKLLGKIGRKGGSASHSDSADVKKPLGETGQKDGLVSKSVKADAPLPPEVEAELVHNIRLAQDKMLEMIDEELAKGGIKVPIMVYFAYPKSDNDCVLTVSPSIGENGIFRFRVGATRCGTDMLVEYYLAKGGIDEMIAFVKAQERVDELKRDCAALSAQVDDKML